MKSSQGKWTNSDKVEALRNPAPGCPRTGSPRLRLFAEWAHFIPQQGTVSPRTREVTVLFQNYNSFLK